MEQTYELSRCALAVKLAIMGIQYELVKGQPCPVFEGELRTYFGIAEAP
jgi:hypothetical protein